MKLIKPHQSLDLIAPYLPENPIIIEAGAFNGKDSIRMATQWPQGIVHAFEPVPELCAQLCQKTSTYKNIVCHQIGLSNTTGSATLYLARKPAKNNRITQASSLLAPKNQGNEGITFPETISIPVITLDQWALQNNIDRIDLVWLDLQGIELDVLKACSTMLKKINIIHIEVATIERYAGQPLYQEVKTWLEKNGFVLIGKDFDETAKSFGNYIFKNSVSL